MIAVPPPETARPLTPRELQQIRGGITTNSYTVVGTGLDNQAFQVSYTNDFGDRGFTIFADSTKVGPVTVIAGGTSGTWQTRTNWPVPGNPQFNTEFDNFSGGWAASYWGATLQVDTNIRVVNVRLWNTTIGGTTTNVTDADMASVLDNLNYTYAWNSTRSSDAIYEQCGSSTKSQRLQFRYVGQSSATLSSCSKPEGCAPSDACSTQAYNIATASGLNLDDLNIFAVPAITGDFVGCNMHTASKYMIFFEAGMKDSTEFHSLLAHEIGHSFWSHYEEWVTPCDTGTVNDALMCPVLGGRKLPSGACEDISSEWKWYLTDQN